MPKRKRKPKKAKKRKYPFIIHADKLTRETAFPTHTHGLTEFGMPEFIMDPLAFGGLGNIQRINPSYDYFIKPENAGKLDAILNGKIIKLTMKDLEPDDDFTEPYVYCYREVTADFEAVKLAYVEDGPGIEPEMRFIQIWVEGDTFALEDDYYRGGVRW